MSTPRKLLYGGLTVVGLIVLGGVALAFLFRDTATPVTREDVTASSVLVGSEPGEPGVYVYRSMGGEEVDALAGARHDYPEDTFAVIRPDPCGVVVRWVALEERWSEWTRCEGEVFPRQEYAFREWFGIPEYTTWVCTPDGDLPAVEPGATWTETCDNGDSVEEATYEIIGFETLEVGGEPVETVHLTRSAVSTGRTRGDAFREEWVMVGTPLVVRAHHRATSVSSSPVGDVTHVEDHTLELIDLYPGS